MVKKLLVALAVLVALLVVLIVTRPDSFSLERSATVSAPPAIVYGLVADFHQWEGWSPWAKLDPAMRTTYTGAGVGATYAWEGNGDVGSGKMTFTDLEAPRRVAITLDFLTPIAATNRTELLLAPEGSGTKVTWRMTGKNGFLSKAAGLVMNMDQLVGKDFEKGLASLKTLAEAAAKQAQAQAPAPEKP
jgi:uncharacterized protein YndB with AHSA1/START domain